MGHSEQGRGGYHIRRWAKGSHERKKLKYPIVSALVLFALIAATGCSEVGHARSAVRKVVAEARPTATMAVTKAPCDRSSGTKYLGYSVPGYPQDSSRLTA